MSGIESTNKSILIFLAIQFIKSIINLPDLLKKIKQLFFIYKNNMS